VFLKPTSVVGQAASVRISASIPPASISVTKGARSLRMPCRAVTVSKCRSLLSSLTARH
jgi:hypothetical protein